MLICARCGSGSIIPEKEFVYGQGWITRPKCLKCGREKFVEAEKPSEKYSKNYSIACDGSENTSPLKVLDKEAKVAKSGMCKFKGCDKNVLAGGYCYRHYKEVNGHPYRGGQKNHKGGNIRMTMTTEQKIIPAAEATQADPVPLIQLFLYPELLEKLTKTAKAEWRTLEGQAAYLIEKALEEKASNDTYQSGSGRRPG